MAQKILICGFPHCGTSILKSIIGHSSDVYEIYEETCKIGDKKHDKKYTLCKWPFTKNVFFEKEYEDYIKIFIIRNPLFVYSSLNKRFNYRILSDHEMDQYLNTLRQFIKYRDNHHKNIYTIRYEDLFDNNYRQLKNILDNCGIKYTDDIFDNTKYTNMIFETTLPPREKPENIDHGRYRTWQINNQFVSNNDISKIDLTELQKRIIFSSDDILNVYPDIRSML